MTRAAVPLAVSLALMVSACTIDKIPDNNVYFDNRTSRTLHLRLRDPAPEEKDWGLVIKANAVTGLLLIPEGLCSGQWLILDERGKLVKDPGRICWHDTITIP